MASAKPSPSPSPRAKERPARSPAASPVRVAWTWPGSTVPLAVPRTSKTDAEAVPLEAAPMAELRMSGSPSPPLTTLRPARSPSDPASTTALARVSRPSVPASNGTGTT